MSEQVAGQELRLRRDDLLELGSHVGIEVAEWEADEGFGVPTRFFNAQRVVGGVGSGVRRWWEVASHHGC